MLYCFAYFVVSAGIVQRASTDWRRYHSTRQHGLRSLLVGEPFLRQADLDPSRPVSFGR